MSCIFSPLRCCFITIATAKGRSGRQKTSSFKKSSFFFPFSFIFNSSVPARKREALTPLLLLRELLGADIGTTELDVQHSLHGAEDLLVRCGAASLHVLHDSDGGVALGSELLLGHLVALLCAAALDGVTDLEADGLGLDDVIASVDLGQMLAFDGGSGCLRERSAGLFHREPHAR